MEKRLSQLQRVHREVWTCSGSSLDSAVCCHRTDECTLSPATIGNNYCQLSSSRCLFSSSHKS